jgi:meckelin
MNAGRLQLPHSVQEQVPSSIAALACSLESQFPLVQLPLAPQVVIPTYWQRMFRMPPAAAANKTLLQHDFYHSFSTTIFYGQELRLYVFDAMLFSSLHMTLGNAACAGFITFMIQQLVRLIRHHCGESNLSRKTLVDRHFLV